MRGSTFSPDQDPSQLDRSSYVLACDIEYARYLGHQNASEVFHAHGGQVRLDFYNAVFEGTSDFGIVQEFRSRARGVQLRLIEAGLLAPLGTLVPRRCYALGRTATLPPEVQRAIREQVLTADDGW